MRVGSAMMTEPCAECGQVITPDAAYPVESDKGFVYVCEVCRWDS